MKKLLLLTFLICGITSFSQKIIEYKGEKINALDENNNKTGIWKLFDEEKNILYSVIKDYNNETLYIFENDCYLIPFKNLEDKPEGNFNYNLVSNKIHNIKIIYDNNII